MSSLRQLFAKLSSGAPLDADNVVALLMLITMVASTAHLITMLATRWGEKQVAMKSLVASVLIHGACILGLEVFEPLTPQTLIAIELPPTPPEQQTQILVQSEQDIQLSQSGNTALADLPVPSDVELQRLEQTPQEVTPAELPEQKPDTLESLSTTVQDVSQFEERDMTELAAAADAGTRGPRQAAAADPAADIKTTIDRNSADVAAPLQVRTRPERGDLDDSPSQPDPQMPQSSAPELELKPTTDDVAMKVATNDMSSMELPEATVEESNSIQRRTGPVVTTDPAEASGMAITVPRPRPGTARSFQPRLPRPSRSQPEDSPAPVPTRETVDVPQTPTPLASSYEDVRVGMIAPEFSESIVTSTPLMEADLPRIRRRDNPPPTYQLRNVETRRDAARRFGGTQRSEAAVERSLKWLASMQMPDGRWDAEDHGSGKVKLDENGVDRNFAGKEADTGVTALVTLSFLGAGYTHERGHYAFEVDHALEWLINQQGPDGNLCGKAEHFARMYCHAMATYALAEAYGMQKEKMMYPIIAPELVAEPTLVMSQVMERLSATLFSQPVVSLPLTPALHRQNASQLAYSLRRVDDIRLSGALARAVSFTIGQQDPKSGGWRYKFGQEGDVSMFGWQMMSLKSAEIAGVTVPPIVRQRMNNFLNSVRQGDKGGLFGYRRNSKTQGRDTEPVTPVMTAEALFCQQMLGYPRDTESSRESVAYILRNIPRVSELNYYYWYYGTLAMYQFGGKPWEDWNNVVRDSLIEQQRPDGEFAGSWDPSDPWGRYGGRLYSTALATLTLEVYYRLLPLYRMNDAESPAAK